MADLGPVERLLRQDRAVVLAAMATIVAIAAVYTVLGIGLSKSAVDTTAMVGGPDMGMLMAPAAWTPGYAVLVFLMWWVMMVAMMLPSAAPTVLLYTALARRMTEAASPTALAAAFVAGYLIVWAGFSVVATGLQRVLELRGLVSPDLMALTSRLLGGSMMLAAAAYQLSPLKRMCLEHCRGPLRFLVEHRRPGTAGALVMGLEHGAFCLGCCWFLMALLFVGGIMNLYWVAGLAVFVAIEKLAPVGGRLATASALALVTAGLWMVAGAIV